MLTHLASRWSASVCLWQRRRLGRVAAASSPVDCARPASSRSCRTAASWPKRRRWWRCRRSRTSSATFTRGTYRSELAEAALVALQEEPHQLTDLHPRYAARSIDRCHACATAAQQLSPRSLSPELLQRHNVDEIARRHASLSKSLFIAIAKNWC